jgi:hypothetical protein
MGSYPKHRKNVIAGSPGDFVTQVCVAGGKYYLVHDSFESTAFLTWIDKKTRNLCAAQRSFTLKLIPSAAQIYFFC